MVKTILSFILCSYDAFLQKRLGEFEYVTICKNHSALFIKPKNVQKYPFIYQHCKNVFKSLFLLLNIF